MLQFVQQTPLLFALSLPVCIAQPKKLGYFFILCYNIFIANSAAQKSPLIDILLGRFIKYSKSYLLKRPSAETIYLLRDFFYSQSDSIR